MSYCTVARGSALVALLLAACASAPADTGLPERSQNHQESYSEQSSREPPRIDAAGTGYEALAQRVRASATADCTGLERLDNRLISEQQLLADKPDEALNLKRHRVLAAMRSHLRLYARQQACAMARETVS